MPITWASIGLTGACKPLACVVFKSTEIARVQAFQHDGIRVRYSITKECPFHKQPPSRTFLGARVFTLPSSGFL